MKDSWKISILFILPYIFLLILGVWYYAHITPLALADGDSFGYLSPAVIKQLTGEWHKGERPMQYLFFLYFTLTKDFRLNHIVTAQQVCTLLGGGLLTLAWLTYIKSMKNPSVLWHLAGYFMLAIYISSPDLMYFAQFIGPEIFSMFFMCVLIFSLSVALSGNTQNKARAIFLAIAIFTNLYLINPMPKWIFAGVFLEMLLTWLVVRFKSLSVRHRLYVLAVPHFLYLMFVITPEAIVPVESADHDRVFIEYEQMAYTHFDLLAQDRSNFPVSASLQDSLVQYFNEARANEVSNKLIGFSNDYLMWQKGKAKDAVYDYYKGNYDSIGRFYKGLCFKLVARYPLALTHQIIRQVWAFYVPNKIVHKDLYKSQSPVQCYGPTRDMVRSFDQGINAQKDTWQKKYNGTIKPDLISFQYPGTYPDAGLKTYFDLHLPFSGLFSFFLGFDYIFLASMLLFFITRWWQGRFFELHYISLLYVLMAIYVVTVGIVHTFDIDRFIDTIYPFILITTFFGFLYWVQEIINLLKAKYPVANEKT